MNQIIETWHLLANIFGKERFADEILSFSTEMLQKYDSYLFENCPFKMPYPGLLIDLENIDDEFVQCSQKEFICNLLLPEQFTINDAILIGKILKNNSSLQELNFHYSYRGCRKVIVEISSALKMNSNLKSLLLRQTNPGRDGIIAIANALKVNSSLKRLDFSFSCIGNYEKAAIRFVSALEKNSTLENLELKNNFLEDDFAFKLADILKTNSALKRIDLSENYFTHEGCIAIVEALEFNTTLKELSLENNCTGEKTEMALKKCQRDIRV